MERKALIALAIKLGLEFKKNISTKKLIEQVAEKMNEVIKPLPDVDKPEGLSIDLKDMSTLGKTFCGKSPITGEEIWK